MHAAVEASQRTKYAILITGEHGGTGSSTTAKALAEELGIERISGGKLLRALAWKFRDFVTQQKASLHLETIYYNFHDICRQIYDKEGNTGLSTFLSDVVDRPHDETVLKEFHTAINAYPLTDGNPATVWDCFVDTQIFGQVLDAERPVVLESKLAIALPFIDQIASVYTEHPALAMPMLLVLLQVDIGEAATRVSSREAPVTPEQILERQARDFARYEQLYHIAQEPLTMQALQAVITPEREQNFSAITIDTTHNDVAAVVRLIVVQLHRLLAESKEPVSVFCTQVLVRRQVSKPRSQ